MGLVLTYDMSTVNDVGVNIQSEEDKGTCVILSFKNVAQSQSVYTF